MHIVDLRAVHRRREEQERAEADGEFIRRKLAAAAAFKKNAQSRARTVGFYLRQAFVTVAGLATLFLVAHAGSLNPSASPASTMHTLWEIASKSDSPDGYNRTLHSLQAISGDLLGTATSTADFIFAPTATTSTTFWSVDTGGGNVTISFDTSASSPPYSGIGSIKAAVASGIGANNSGIIAYNPQGVWNISQFTNIVLYFRTSSTAMASYFVKLKDSQGTPASNTYTFTPTVANQWEKIILPIASPSSTSGTLDKTNIDQILVGITEPASAATMNFWVEAPGVSGGSGLATIESVRRDTMNIGTPQDATTTPAAAGSVFSGMKFLAQRQYKMQTFTSSGTWTWPGNHVSTVLVTITGGGGGGGGGNTAKGGGGGGAGQTYVRYPVSVSANVTVTVGSGGSGGAAANAGNNGMNTSFGSLSVNGGRGGNPGGTSNSGGNSGGGVIGGTASGGVGTVCGNGILSSSGGSGGGGGVNGGAAGGTGGVCGFGGGAGVALAGAGGGGSAFGTGGNGGGSNVPSDCSGGSGTNGATSAGGGGGGWITGTGNGCPGGGGGDGLVIVEWFE